MKRAAILALVIAAMGIGSAIAQGSNAADINRDGVVDLSDFALFAGEWADISDFARFCETWLWESPADDMVFIPGGEFEMGDSFGEGGSHERPVHTVTVDSFYMGRYEITNGLYCAYLNSAQTQGLITIISGVVHKAGSGTSHPYCATSISSADSWIAYSAGTFSVRSKGGRSMAADPMVKVSWYGATAYCNWRSLQEGYQECYDLSTWKCDFSRMGYRLATEAQWQRAARGGLSGQRFPWGDAIDHDHANFRGNGSAYGYDTSPYTQWTYHPMWDDGTYPYTAPVGSFVANAYGLYDMAGNVYEWCNDWWSSSYYDSSGPINPTGPTSGTSRVLCGGAWNNDAYYCRLAHRYSYRPDVHNIYAGFRVVLGP